MRWIWIGSRARREGGQQAPGSCTLSAGAGRNREVLRNAGGLVPRVRSDKSVLPKSLPRRNPGPAGQPVPIRRRGGASAPRN